MSVKGEFKVNDYITLKLEDDGHERKSVIYVAGERFRTCAYLLLVRPNELFQEEIESIDDAADQHDEILHDDEIRAEDVGLSPEQEFIGHCSNLQAWHEHGYDTRLLHSNLAFPLLKRLKEAGDKSAAKKYYDELLDRYFHGNEKTRIFLEEEGYFKDIPKETQLRILNNEEERKCLKNIERILGEESSFFLNSTSFRVVVEKSNLKEIYFEKQKKLKTLPSCISNFKNLKKIIIKGHFITDIPYWVNKLKDLECLIIERGYEGLNSLPDELFEIKNLKDLKLSNNQISYLPISIRKLKNLEMLDISWNNIKTLPKEIGKLTRLKFLRISNIPLINLPESIRELINLENIDLSKTQIKCLPKALCNLNSLETINISQTKIKKLPECIKNLKKLKKLFSFESSSYMEPTPLKILPESIGELKSLEELIIQGGELETLPENFKKLKNLKNLDLRGNQLKSLPESFGELSSLRNLNLTNNKIKFLPASFTKLEKLKTLKLANNKLNQLPKDFYKLRRLRELHLVKNPIDSFPANLFHQNIEILRI